MATQGKSNNNKRKTTKSLNAYIDTIIQQDIHTEWDIKKAAIQCYYIDKMGLKGKKKAWNAYCRKYSILNYYLLINQQ